MPNDRVVEASQNKEDNTLDLSDPELVKRLNSNMLTYLNVLVQVAKEMAMCQINFNQIVQFLKTTGESDTAGCVDPVIVRYKHFKDQLDYLVVHLQETLSAYLSNNHLSEFPISARPVSSAASLSTASLNVRGTVSQQQQSMSNMKVNVTTTAFGNMFTMSQKRISTSTKNSLVDNNAS